MEKQIQFNDASDKRPGQIKRDIELTRDSMGNTIEEIKERISPRYVKERVKEATIKKTIEVIETTVAHARKWGGSVERNLKEHPAWYAAAGAGAGGLLWLLARRRHNSRRQSSQVAGSFGGSTEFMRGQSSRGGNTAANVKQKGGELKSRLTKEVVQNLRTSGGLKFLLGVMTGIMTLKSRGAMIGEKREKYGVRQTKNPTI